MNSQFQSTEILRLGPDHVASLGLLFRELREAGEERDFRPHPLTEDAVRGIFATCVRDLYYVVVENGAVLGYGMLRGWDEGFDVPSLGIAISPKARGQGLGLAFMRFLHFAAKRAGASRVRLTVNSDNEAALRLYRTLGYTFESMDDRLVGHIAL